MEKNKSAAKLEINIQKDINSYLYLALPLCVVRTNENLTSWFYENFIEVNLNFSNDLQYTGFDSIQSFTPIFDLKLIPEELIGNNIIKIVKENIDKGYYSYIYLDEFYIPFNKKYHLTHFFHEILIYGYDDNKEEFSVIAFNSKEIFASSTCGYIDLETAYKEGTKINELSKIPLTLFKNKNFVEPYNFSLKNFLSKLYNYINSIPVKDKEFFHFHAINNVNSLYIHGVDLNNKLCESIEKHFLEINYNCFHLLCEHKVGIHTRLMYIYDRYKLDSRFSELIKKWKFEIVKKFKIMRMFKLKNKFIKDYELISNKIVSTYKEAMICEIKLLLEIYKFLENYLTTPQIPVTDINKSATICEVVDFNCKDYEYCKKLTYKWDKKQNIDRIYLDCFENVKINFNDNSSIYLNSPPQSILINKKVTFIPKDIDLLQFDFKTNNPYIIKNIKININVKNLSRNCKLTASSIWESENSIPDEFSAEKAADGRSDTHWNARKDRGKGEFIIAEFDSDINFNCIIIQQRKADRINGYKLQYIDSNNKWQDIYSYYGSLIGYIPIKHCFNTAKSTAVKLLVTSTITDSSGFSEPGIRAFDIYYDESYENNCPGLSSPNVEKLWDL